MRGRLVKNQAPSRKSLEATESGLNKTQALPNMNMTEQFASQICNTAFVVQAYYPQNLNQNIVKLKEMRKTVTERLSKLAPGPYNDKKNASGRGSREVSTTGHDDSNVYLMLVNDEEFNNRDPRTNPIST